jgi:hypothetical protein
MGIINHVTKKIKDLEEIGFKITDVKLGDKESSFHSRDNTGRLRKHTYRPKMERIENVGVDEPVETAETNPNAPVKRGRGRPKKRA